MYIIPEMLTINGLTVNKFRGRKNSTLCVRSPECRSQFRSKIRAVVLENGKKARTTMEVSKLGLVARIPESQFSLGRNWAGLDGLGARNESKLERDSESND